MTFFLSGLRLELGVEDSMVRSKPSDAPRIPEERNRSGRETHPEAETGLVILQPHNDKKGIAIADHITR